MTENALLELIRRSVPESDGEGMTIAEMVESSGRGPGVLRTEIARLIRSGQVECARAPRIAIDGTFRPVPIYRVKSGD